MTTAGEWRSSSSPVGTVRMAVAAGPAHEVSSPATACLRARRASRRGWAGRRAGAPRAAWRQALGELCDWAWRVAIGPVLAAVPGRRGDMPHIVLVPGGELGLVAWHAARRAAGGGHQYAAQEAVISVRLVGPPVRRDRRAAAAAVGAGARADLRRGGLGLLHRGGDHVTCTPRTTRAPLSTGTHTSDSPPEVGLAIPGRAAATSADVLAALPHGAFPGASLLHFGCHGRARVPVARRPGWTSAPGTRSTVGGRPAGSQAGGQARCPAGSSSSHRA